MKHINSFENFVNEAAEKEYTIIQDRRGKEKEMTGTLSYFIDYFSYTLEKGQSWEREKGNKKINRYPKTIASLIDNLNNAENNAAANGYSGVSYNLVK